MIQHSYTCVNKHKQEKIVIIQKVVEKVNMINLEYRKKIKSCKISVVKTRYWFFLKYLKKPSAFDHIQ